MRKFSRKTKKESEPVVVPNEPIPNPTPILIEEKIEKIIEPVKPLKQIAPVVILTTEDIPNDNPPKKRKLDNRYYVQEEENPLLRATKKGVYLQRCGVCGEWSHDTASWQLRDCPGTRFCPECQIYGHKIESCPKKNQTARCTWCLAKSHTKQNCPNVEFFLTPSIDQAKVTCFVCGKLGHSNCAHPKKESPVLYCFMCGAKGHVGMDCNKAKTVSGEKKKYVRKN